MGFVIEIRGALRLEPGGPVDRPRRVTGHPESPPMPILQEARRSPRLRRAWTVVSLLGALSAATSAGADVIKKEDMLHGITMTRPQCEAIAQTVWLNVSGHDFCVRYYLSTAGGE